MKRKYKNAVLTTCALLGCVRGELVAQMHVLPQECRQFYTRGAVSILLDFDSARRTLEVLRGNTKDEDIAAALRLRGNELLLEAASSAGTTDSDASFARSLRELSAGRGIDNDPFRLAMLKERGEAVSALLGNIENDCTQLLDPVIDRLHQFIPVDQGIKAEVYVVIGGTEPVFATGNAALIVSLSACIDDYDGLVSAFAHHLFVLAAMMAVDSDRTAPITAEARCITLMNRAFVEGTAHLMGEPFESNIEGGFVHTFINEYREDLLKIEQNFRMFEMMLSRLYSDPSASAGDLENTYRIGFADVSLSPVHFVGYFMARAIEDVSGRGAIAELLERGPVPFFKKYVEIYSAHEDVSLIRFDDAVEEIIIILDEHDGHDK